MADVLDQSEVDALLAAVEGGGDSESADAGADQASESAASSYSAPASTAAPRRDVTTYDFKRPERVSKDQMRALEAIHEGFARNFGAALSGFMRTIVEVHIANTEQLTYSEFIHSLPNPTCFNVIEVKPLEGSVCLEISPLIIYPIIDRLLGGSNAEIFIPQRPLTSIEQRLVSRITDRAVRLLTEVWSSLVPVEFELTETESNPHLVQIVAPNEPVVVISFELKMGTRAGTMSLCVPFNIIEPNMEKLATQNWLAYGRKSYETGKVDLEKSLGGASVGLRVLLAETTITLRDLIELQPGDIIRTEKDADQDAIVQVEGRTKFHGRVGVYRENRAVSITNKVENIRRNNGEDDDYCSQS